jgi:hypothetical protein
MWVTMMLVIAILGACSAFAWLWTHGADEPDD